MWAVVHGHVDFAARFLSDALHLVAGELGSEAAAEQLLGQVDRLIGLTEEVQSSDTSQAGTPSRDLVGEIMRSIQPIVPKARTNLLSGRILVVDDTEANRDLLSRRLRRICSGPRKIYRNQIAARAFAGSVTGG